MAKLMHRLKAGKPAKRTRQLGMNELCPAERIPSSFYDLGEVAESCLDFPLKTGVGAFIAEREKRVGKNFVPSEIQEIEDAVDRVVSRYRARNFLDAKEARLESKDGDTVRAAAIAKVVNSVTPEDTDSFIDLDKTLDDEDEEAKREDTIQQYQENDQSYAEGKCEPTTYVNTFFKQNNVPAGDCETVTRDFAVHAFLKDYKDELTALWEKNDETGDLPRFTPEEVGDLLDAVDLYADRYLKGKFTPEEMQLKLNTYSPARLTALAAAKVRNARPDNNPDLRGNQAQSGYLYDKARADAKRATQAPKGYPKDDREVKREIEKEERELAKEIRKEAKKPSPPKPIAEPQQPKPPKIAKPRKGRAKKEKAAEAEMVPAANLPVLEPIVTEQIKKSEIVAGPGRNRHGAEIVGRFEVAGKPFACHLKRVRVNQYTTEMRPKVFCYVDAPAAPKRKAAKSAA